MGIKFEDVFLLIAMPINAPKNNRADEIRKSFFLIEANTLLSSTSCGIGNAV